MRKYLALCSLLSACTTVQLTPEGEIVRITQRPISDSCQTIKNLETEAEICDSLPYSEAKNEVLNDAATLKATHVTFTTGTGCTATYVRCGETFDLSRAKQLELCKTGNRSACLDFASADEGDPEIDAHKLYEVRVALCKKGDKPSCLRSEYAKRILEAKLKKEQDDRKQAAAAMGGADQMQALEKGCKSRRYQDCLDIAVLAAKGDDLELAIKYSQFACSKGYVPACEMHREYQNQKAKLNDSSEL